MEFIHMKKKYILYAIPVILLFLICMLIPNFLSINNLLNVVRQSSITAIVACGMTMVIIVKGIDLSVGGIISCCAMINGLLLLQGMPIPIAMLIGFSAGILMGLFNGLMVESLEIPAFIITLVVGQVATGIALILNNGRSIGGFPSRYVFMGNGAFLGIPISDYITFVVVVVSSVIMVRTCLGTHIYALGGNEMVVKQQGIKTSKINFFVFGFSGFCAALAGILLSAQMDTVHPTQGDNYQLDAVAACIMGGVNMMGGEGKIYLSLVGAIVIGLLRNALNLLGIHPFYQNIIVGFLIIVVVAITITNKNRKIEQSKVF